MTVSRSQKMAVSNTDKTDIYKHLRRSWGNVNPTSLVHTDKTKYSRKRKHKNQEQYD